MGMLRFSFKITLILIFLSCESFAKEGKEQIPKFDEYLLALKEFKKQACQKTDEQSYKDLLSEYRGRGFYLPRRDKTLDLISLRLGLKLLDEKIEWLEQTEKKIKKGIDRKSIDHSLEQLESIIDQLLQLKFQFEKHKVKKAVLEGQQKRIQLHQQWKKLSEKIFFLKNFNFPTDHLKNRADYESLDEQKETIKRNLIFTKRKILEDGASESDGSGSDLMLRSVFDSIQLQFPIKENFLSDQLRSDLDWFLKSLKSYLRKNNDQKIQKRHGHWLSRVRQHREYYNGLLLMPPQKRRQIALHSYHAQRNISDFNDQKQLATYLFWQEKSEAMQKIFALDSLLLHEVGRVDPTGLERLDVLNVFINRVNLEPFNHLAPQQALRVLLDRQKSPASAKWLNTLLRRGEFSFTYFYIPSSYHLYCPDIYPGINNLRKENYRLIKQSLAQQERDSKLIGYFSRVSMLGRIDMSSVWTHWSDRSERPGSLIREQSSSVLKKALKNGNFRYYYHFLYQGEQHWVIEIQEQTYVMKGRLQSPIFYHYRNPHLFRFFRLVSTD